MTDTVHAGLAGPAAADGECEPLNLICIPHAGGSARTFLRWRREMPPSIRVIPLELPGRGSRARQQRPATLGEAARDLAGRFDPTRGYAILGHSMGGLLAYEMARLLCARQATAPRFVVLAGTRPPHHVLPGQYRKLADLSDEALLAALESAGTVQAVRRSPMRDLFTPIVRGDLELIARYRPQARPEPLPVDLLVWTGADDATTPRGPTAQWQLYSSRPCRFRVFEGDHFFVHRDLDVIAGAVLSAGSASAPRG